MRHRGAGVALAALVLVAGHAARAADDPARVIEYAHDALTVHITKVQLDEVITEIGRQAGAEIRGGVKSPREVTAEFDAVPLTEALHRLLGDQNFALVYGEGGSLRAIKLLGGPLAAPAPGTGSSPAVVAPPAKPYDTVGTLVSLVANHPPVAVTGKLALALGTPNATIPQLVDTGLHHEDGAVRAEAIRRGLQVIEAEPELRAAVLTSLKGMDDPELATVLLGAAGPRADEVAMHVATQARASELRIKASGVRQQLRARVGGSGG